MKQAALTFSRQIIDDFFASCEASYITHANLTPTESVQMYCKENKSLAPFEKRLVDWYTEHEVASSARVHARNNTLAAVVGLGSALAITLSYTSSPTLGYVCASVVAVLGYPRIYKNQFLTHMTLDAAKRNLDPAFDAIKTSYANELLTALCAYARNNIRQA